MRSFVVIDTNGRRVFEFVPVAAPTVPVKVQFMIILPIAFAIGFLIAGAC